MCGLESSHPQGCRAWGQNARVPCVSPFSLLDMSRVGKEGQENLQALRGGGVGNRIVLPSEFMFGCCQPSWVCEVPYKVFIELEPPNSVLVRAGEASDGSAGRAQPGRLNSELFPAYFQLQLDVSLQKPRGYMAAVCPHHSEAAALAVLSDCVGFLLVTRSWTWWRGRSSPVLSFSAIFLKLEKT